MITFPLNPNARVEMIDARHAILDSLVIDPATQSVTQLVVSDAQQVRHLIPLKWVASADGSTVRLRISSEQFLAIEPFDESQFVAQPDNERDFFATGTENPVTVYFQTSGESASARNLAGDLQLVRGAYVEAADGSVGSVVEIVINPESGQISHLVIHTHKKEELKLPVTLIDRVESDTVYLKLTKKEIDSLPGAKLGSGKRRYDLVARVFGTMDQAETAYKNFKLTYPKQSRYWLASVAILVRNEQGEVSIKETGDTSAKSGGVKGAVAGGLVGLLGGPVGVVVGALAGAGMGGLAAGVVDGGISNDFLKQFAEELKPGTSAFVLLVDHERMPELSSAMANLSGVLVQEELTDQMIQKYLSKDKE